MCFQCRTRAADKFLKNAPQLLSGKTIKLRLACIWVKCGFSSAATSAFYTFKIRRSADPHFTPGHSRTGHLADWSTLGLDNSRTGQVADWTTRGCHRQLCVLSFRSFGGICETANCPVRDLSSPRDVESASWQSASWRIRELSSYPERECKALSSVKIHGRLMCEIHYLP